MNIVIKTFNFLIIIYNYFAIIFAFSIIISNFVIMAFGLLLIISNFAVNNFINLMFYLYYSLLNKRFEKYIVIYNKLEFLIFIYLNTRKI